MNNQEKQKIIVEFLHIIRKEYSEIYINYYYNVEADQFFIYHDDYNLQFDNEKFNILIYELIEEMFYGNDFVNFSFGFDGLKVKEDHKRIFDSLKNYTFEDIEIKTGNLTIKNCKEDETSTMSENVYNENQKCSEIKHWNISDFSFNGGCLAA
jgi:hypothetical protein